MVLEERTTMDEHAHGSVSGCCSRRPLPWKVAVALDGARRRIKTWTGPPNVRRFDFQTPCAETGVCSDCRSPQRICRVTTVIDRAPRATELSVCLTNDSPGY
jgi:hypothetical protein